MNSHYTWGSVTTLHDFGGALGRASNSFFRALIISWSWLLARVCSGPKTSRKSPCIEKNIWDIPHINKKENRKMSTSNWLNSETPGSRPVMPQNVPRHRRSEGTELCSQDIYSSVVPCICRISTYRCDMRQQIVALRVSRKFRQQWMLYCVCKNSQFDGRKYVLLKCIRISMRTCNHDSLYTKLPGLTSLVMGWGRLKGRCRYTQKHPQ